MSRRMCSVVHGTFPLGEPRVARQARAALRAGWSVDVLALAGTDEARHEAIDGVNVWRAPFGHKRGAGMFRTALEYTAFAAYAFGWILRRSAKRQTRYGVVQVNNPPDFLVFACVVARVFGARILFDIHDLSTDMFHMRFGARAYTKLADVLLRRVERLALRMADVVTTVHKPYAAVLSARVPAVEPIVVMNTLDEELLPERELPAGSRCEVVYHGTLTPSYGADILLEAFAELWRQNNGLSLALLGDGDARQPLIDRSHEFGISRSVTFSQGYLPHREVLARIAGATVGVIPNRPSELNRFALSSKLFEYVAMGIPVVCADLETLRGHFSDSEVRFFRAGSASSLADALRESLQNPEAAHARAANARQRYNADYRWPVSELAYLRALAC